MGSIVVAKSCGACAVAIGGLAIAAVAFEPLGARIGFSLMPATAAALVLGGSSLFTQVSSPGRRRGEILGASVAAIGVLGLVPFGPTRMSSGSCVSAVLIGAALSWRRASQPLAVATALVASVVLIGYLYGVREFSGIAAFARMMPEAAASFAVLSAGVLAATSETGPMTSALLRDSPGGYFARRVMPAAIAAPILLGALVAHAREQEIVSAHFGGALFATATIVLLSLLVWRTAANVDRLDSRVRREETMRQLSDALRQEAAEATAVLDVILSRAPVAFALVDRDESIELLNGRFTVLVGRSAIGAKLGDVLPDALHPQVLPHVRSAFGGETVLEVDLSGTIAGTLRHWLAGFYPVSVIGDVRRVGIVLVEITERKRHLEQVEREAATREELLAIVSHDLRAPLSSIAYAAHAVVERAKRGAVAPDAARTSADTILRSCDQMDSLIASLLDLASARHGTLTIGDPEPVAVASLFQDARRLLVPAAEKKGVRIEMDAHDAVVACDRRRVLQVIANLGGNAVKFTPAGGRVSFVATACEHDVVIEVADTGRGIDPDELEHVFQPYWRRDASQRGVGLGLYIARTIVELHGGTIAVESTPGAGSRFRFTLRSVPVHPRHPTH